MSGRNVEPYSGQEDIKMTGSGNDPGTIYLRDWLSQHLHIFRQLGDCGTSFILGELIPLLKEKEIKVIDSSGIPNCPSSATGKKKIRDTLQYIKNNACTCILCISPQPQRLQFQHDDSIQLFLRGGLNGYSLMNDVGGNQPMCQHIWRRHADPSYTAVAQPVINPSHRNIDASDTDTTAYEPISLDDNAHDINIDMNMVMGMGSLGLGMDMDLGMADDNDSALSFPSTMHSMRLESLSVHSGKSFSPFDEESL